MSSADLSLPQTGSLRAPAYTADVAQVWRSVDWTGSISTPFQRAEWLDAFYAASAKAPEKCITPLVVTIRDAQGELAMRLPLMRYIRGGLSVIEFADLELTDFNAPVLGPAAPATAKDARAAMRALRRILPRADLLSFKKMPPRLDGRPNPFTLLRGLCLSNVNGNVIQFTGDWEAYHRTRNRNVRMELGRSWRNFEKNEGARFRVISNPDEALRVLETMEAQQRARMQEVGAPYILNDPMPADFYRRLLSHAGSGFALLTILEVKDELVAASLGICDQGKFVAIRLTNAGRKWSSVSPGRLVAEETLKYLHTQGFKTIDLSIGNYSYKRRLAVTRTPLMDLTLALSWRGIPEQVRARLATTIRKYPGVHARIRALLGKPASREEN